MTDAHNKSIVGKGTVWYEMAYEDAVKERMQMEAQGIVRELYDEDSDSDEVGTDDDDDDEEDFDYSILGDPSANVSNQPYVNGTESRLSDEGMFEDQSQIKQTDSNNTVLVFVQLGTS